MNLCNDELKAIVGLLKGALQIIQILIPIGLIIYGTIDLGKAVMSGDEKEIKSHQTVLMKRALAAVLVFLIATVVGFVMGFVGNADWKTCWQQAKQCTNGYNPITGGCKD